MHTQLKKLKLSEEDIILKLPCCYANNLFNKVKENLSGSIVFQKKYLYISDNGKVVESSFDPDEMENDYNHVSITRNIGLINISLDDYILKIIEINKERFII